MRRLLGLPLPPIEKSGVGCREKKRPWIREVGVVTVTSRYSIKQRTNSNEIERVGLRTSFTYSKV